MLWRIVVSLISATFFSWVGLVLLHWTWEISHAPAEPSAPAEMTIYAVIVLVFTLIACCTFSLINPHEKRMPE